jgi:RNA polymerase sigma factor (sigma-70 family)
MEPAEGVTMAPEATLEHDPGESATRDEFGGLVKRFQDGAFAYAYALLRNRAMAEDATQAAFLTAWLHRSALRDRAAFGGWLRTIVRTECYRLFRRERVLAVSLETLSPAAEPRVDETHLRDLGLTLLQAIAALPEASREAISLRYLSDLSYQEIAAFLDVPVTTVKKRLHDARGRLQRWLRSLTAENQGQAVLRSYRLSAHPALENAVMLISEFLDNVASGQIAAVQTALDENPRLLREKGRAVRFSIAGANALAIAAVCGGTEMVALLLARGAEPDDATAAGVSAIALAAIEGNDDVVRLLIDAGCTIDIFAAAALGDAAMVERFVSTDRALSRTTLSSRRTPLHFARSISVAQVLLEAGAELDPVDVYGMTPLQWIGCTGRYKDVCRYLMAQGAQHEASDVFWACAYGDVEAVRRWLESDPALVKTRRPPGPGVPLSSVGNTPLHEAAIRGEREIAALLLEHGADVNAVGQRSDLTPLHGAAWSGHRETADLLVAAGADLQAKHPVFGATPADLARGNGHGELADRLTPRS